MKKCIKMYENNYKNPVHTGLKELEQFLQLIGDLNEPMELFAMGGTAMVLCNIKATTKDIDFMTTSTQEQMKKLLTLAGLKEHNPSGLCNTWHLGKIRIDLFYGGYILGVELPADWKEKSSHVQNIGKVKLHVLNWEDIIITKVARSEPRDIEDCIDIVKSQKLSLNSIKKRYYSVADTSLISDYQAKFEALESGLKHAANRAA